MTTYPQTFEEVLKMARNIDAKNGNEGYRIYNIMANAGKAAFAKEKWQVKFPKTLEDAARFEAYNLEDAKVLFDLLITAGNDNSEEARKFLQMANLIGAAMTSNLNGHESEVIFLRNAKALTDEQLKYDFLTSIPNMGDKKANYEKHLMIAQTSFAKVKDMQMALSTILAYFHDYVGKTENKDWPAEQKEIAAKIANDLLALADKELYAEVEKDVPDIKIIERLKSDSIYALRFLPISADYNQGKAAEQKIEEKFDIDKLLGDTEYLAKYDKNVLLENEELKAQVETLTENMAQKEREFTQTQNTTGQRIQELDGQVKTLTERVGTLQQEKSAALSNAQQAQTKLEEVTEAGKKLRTGFGSKGVNATRIALGLRNEKRGARS